MVEYVRMPAQTRYFQIANHYLGWGEPKNGLWFIGLEEATPWKIEDLERHSENPVEISPHQPHDGTFSSLDRKGRSIRAITSKIAYRLSRRFADQSWRVYQQYGLWQPGCKLAQLNFYPLGKASWWEWPDDFKQLFGYASHERAHYLAEVSRTRHVRIKQLYEEGKPQAVVCFGNDAHDSARSIFGLDGQEAQEIVQGAKAYPNRKVILTPFFRYQHFPNSSAECVAQQLKDWGVELP